MQMEASLGGGLGPIADVDAVEIDKHIINISLQLQMYW
jgi:hypothetical protein